MMLAALCGYYKRASTMPGVEVIPPGYAKLGVAGELIIDREGNLVGASSLSHPTAKKKTPLPMIVPLPPKRSGQKPEPAFLYETVAFLFGIYPKPEGAAYRFEASEALHREVLGDCDDEGAKALLAFFSKRKQGNTTYEGADTSLLEDERTFVVFRLQGEGEFLHQRLAIQKAWRDYNARKSQDREIGQCLITGEVGPIARVHGNIGGFGADKPTLIGFNQDAFCSFGKYGKQGANAPVGEEAAFQYVTALNMLVSDPNHFVNLAGDKMLFWAERDAPAEESLFSQLFQGESQLEKLDSQQRDRIKGVLNNLYKGGDPRDFQLDPTVQFYILGVNANKTRLVVRFFYESNFGTLLENLMAHYQDIEIVGARYQFPAFYFILLETAVQRKRENVPENLESALVQSILDNTPYPLTLAQAVLRRVRAESSISALQAGVLKGTVNRHTGKEELKVALDTTKTDKAYLLGRLFAMFERTQYIALGDVNSSVTDKYLSAALSNPEAVFPHLMDLNTRHLRKSVPPEKKGSLIYLRKEILNLMGMMDLETNENGDFVFPSAMDSNNQCKFMVGYYHQTQHFFAKKTDGQQDDSADQPDNQDE